MNLYKRVKRSIKGRLIKYVRRFGSPTFYANYLYEFAFNESIDWKNPKDLNQWINYLEYFSDTSMWSLLADKYRVREYVVSKGFSSELIPLLQRWDNVNNLNISELPPHMCLR